ncbi:ShlB/FhaC/HecB family hemolysin secretion/activation protein [Oleiagrimonas sp. C23AA]|uniref:ShlB/FhaC/HecB family hemolysin secretion/activation protein n=1 Tax=Oleiagrimonas sp. C23AA TaxID=2719047 RepID=UPI0014249296|nr:ShlB/FhaC/HecB family hemolysin secretion/activation protein [Oleiagrimonas sp. C23AA]NII12389.1 ShlB/FhaC/HecB family hemolysin secretion/activation protein [Oleiagrimonas sp. C23AA]
MFLPLLDPALVQHQHNPPAQHAPTPQQQAERARVLHLDAPAITATSHGYHYTVRGNTLLDAQYIKDVITRSPSPRDAVGALKKAYAAKGYFLAAIVGRSKGNQVRIQVVQGRLTHVDGPKGLARFFTGLKGDDRVRNTDVIRQSTLAQQYAATNGQLPQISFKPAPEVGGSTMDIGTKPLKNARWWGGSFTTGNFGNRYAGHYLAQLQGYARHDGFTLQATRTRALTGLDKNTAGAYYAATSANLSWVTPLGTYQLDDSFTKFKLGKAFAPLYPLGHIHVYGISGQQLLYADDSTRWTTSEGWHHIRDRESVFNGIYSLHDQKYMVFDGSTTYAKRFGGLFKHAASISLTGGIKLGGSRGDSGLAPQTGAPTGHFQIYTASAELTQSLPYDFNTQLSLSGQASTDTLPSYEQWVLGGVNNLTAYLPGTIVGDRGYLGRFTVNGPQWAFWGLRARPSVFTEYGATRYSFIAQGAPKWQSLGDIGAGLQLSAPGAHTSALLAWARPMTSKNVAATTRSGQRAHLFVYLQVGF